MKRIKQLQNELQVKRNARTVYQWIRWLSLVCVPWFIFLTMDVYGDGIFAMFLVAAVPGIPYFLVLLMFNTSPYPFVVGHARQAMVLVGLRVLSAFFSLVLLYELDFFGLLFFLISNGCLWHFGSRWGATQVEAGECWWIGRSGASGQQVLSRLSIRELENEIRDSKANRKPQPAVQDAPPSVHLPEQRVSESKAKALLRAYRTAAPDERPRIVQEMEALGLVEEF